MTIRIPTCSVVAALFLTSAGVLGANGVNTNGSGGRGRSLNGATVAQPGDAIDAMASNPAALADLERSYALGLFGAYADASYSKRGEPSVGLTKHGGTAPELGVVLPFQESLTLGLAIIPEQARIAEWRYRDAPGGLDGRTSYGERAHKADFIGVRSSIGLAAKLSERLYLGGSLGLVYDRIRLDAPYIFQAEPRLKGAKVALDLETDSISVNGDLGLIFKAHERLQFGLRYRTKTEIDSTGDADGNAGAQFRSLGLRGVPGGFRYDAEVETSLPRSISAGLAWQATDRVRILAQTEWINWSDSFDELTVKLSNGTNRTINALAHKDDVVDHVPLDWHDRFVYRAGIEFEPVNDLWLRLGYSYGKNPIPIENITALNAAISEHSISAGVGFKLGRANIDVAYQYELPATARVGRSNIRAGEYSNSSVNTEVHWLGVSASVPF